MSGILHGDFGGHGLFLFFMLEHVFQQFSLVGARDSRLNHNP